MDFLPNYFSLSRDSEIDFIIQNESDIIPIEVKSSNNKRAISFKNYIKKYKPITALRFSTNEYKTDGNITNIPLYLASKTISLLQETKKIPI
jgi:predicted AAA+ superfamily ATPase